MAARENQGLQIALIIFVMLTIILSVTTYIFFDNYKKEKLEKIAAQDSAKSSDKKLGEVNAEREMYFALINQKDIEEKPESIVKKNDATIQRYIALSGVNTPLKTYPEVLGLMAETVSAKDRSLLAYKEAQDKTTAELAALKSKLEAEVAAAKADTTKSQGEYTAFSSTIKTALAALAQSKSEAEKLINEKVAENQVLNDKIAATVKKAAVTEKTLVGTIKTQKDVIDTYKDERPTLTDGNIVYVDERTKQAYVNIGRADSLQRRVTFSVYDRGTNDVATAVKKGAIEIIEIIDDKISRARIIENSVSDPILPGDFIDSPLWYPGKRLKLAIAGAVDFDKDGVSDRAKLKDIILANGGTVVADVSERGEVMGAITPDTAQLIVGRGPDDRSDAKFTKPWNEITADAKKYNIPVIQLSQFLDSVGYTPSSNSSQDAGNQRLVDTKPKAKDDQGQIVPRFPPRTAPAGSGSSAFQK
jgi:hypothetical protein